MSLKTKIFVHDKPSADAPAPQEGTRRSFLLGAAGGMTTLAGGGWISAADNAAAAPAADTAFPQFAYIGCFSSERRGARGKGISVYRIDPGGAWTLLQTLETVPNPQFIAF